MLLATVKSLDRVNSIANVIPYGQTTPIPAKYQSHRGRPNCWPLGNCYIEQLASGQWQVVGGVGNRRVILHDDFLHASGDTPWTFLLGGASLTQGGLTDGVGVAHFATPLGDVTFADKDTGAIVPPAVPAALHISGRYAFTGTATALNTITIGVNGPGSAAYLQWVGANRNFFVYGTGSLNIVQPAVPVDNTWFTFDLIANPSFVAGWVNAAGPAANTGGTVAAVTPQLEVSGGGSAVDCYLDWYELALVNPVVNPTQLAG